MLHMMCPQIIIIIMIKILNAHILSPRAPAHARYAILNFRSHGNELNTRQNLMFEKSEVFVQIHDRDVVRCQH